MASLGLYAEAVALFQHFLMAYILQARIGLQDFLRGGGAWRRSQAHTPLEHCPRDVVRPPENWKTPPLLDIHKHPPPWTLPVWRHPHSAGGGGGGDRSRSRTHTLLYRLFYQYHTITKNLKYALVMKHQIYRLKVDGANLGIVGIVRPKLLSARLTQTIIRRRHSSCSGLTPALGKPCSLLDRLYFLFFRNI